MNKDASGTMPYTYEAALALCEAPPVYCKMVSGYYEASPDYCNTLSELYEALPDYYEAPPEYYNTLPEFYEAIPGHFDTIPGNMFWQNNAPERFCTAREPYRSCRQAYCNKEYGLRNPAKPSRNGMLRHSRGAERLIREGSL